MESKYPPPSGVVQSKMDKRRFDRRRGPADAACMTEEIFDVVNARDEVIGEERRSEVHRLGLRHRAAHILVFDARGRLFLQKRSATKDRHPGVWDSSASGHVDRGESYEACATRELKEELGLTLTGTMERLFKLEAGPDTGQEFVWVYRCRGEGPFVLPPAEIECGDWFEPDTITRWIKERPAEFAPTFPVIWQRLRAGEQQGSAPFPRKAERRLGSLDSPGA
jgi:isopentenyldiphosphate isomerase